jgi:two-component system response regulator VicR
MKEAITILYVEDDLNLAFVTKDNLVLEGYEVIHCENGKDALIAIEKSKFDLCVLDIMLPIIDGFEIAKVMREKDHNIPIIFLSAKSLPEDKIKGLKLGADDYITKPFSIEELILKIKVFLKRSAIKVVKPAKQEIQKIGKYLFDFENLQLRFKQNQINLTNKEASLLQLLFVRQNQIIKREEILMLIWGDDDYFLGRSLDVFISRLRNYLKKDKTIKIENIHSVGFRFKC